MGLERFLRVQALILDRKVVRGDKLLNLFTREHGKLLVLAPGATKIPNRFGGSIEPLNYGVTNLYCSTAGKFYLKEFDLKESFLGIRSSLDRLREGLSYLSLLSKLLPYEIPEPLLFDSSLAFLSLLEDGVNPGLLSLVATIKAFFILGFLPRFDVCGSCGGKIEGLAYVGSENLSPLCHKCSSGGALAMSGEGIALIRNAQERGFSFFRKARFSLKSMKEVSLYLKMVYNKILGGVEFELSGSDI